MSDGLMSSKSEAQGREGVLKPFLPGRTCTVGASTIDDGWDSLLACEHRMIVYLCVCRCSGPTRRISFMSHHEATPIHRACPL